MPKGTGKQEEQQEVLVRQHEELIAGNLAREQQKTEPAVQPVKAPEEQEQIKAFNQRLMRLCAENYPLIERRVMQSPGEAKEEFTPASKGKAGRIIRKADEKELDALRDKLGNQHIGLYAMRYVKKSTEQKNTRNVFWQEVKADKDLQLTEENRELGIFLDLSDKKGVREKNVAMIKDLTSRDQARMRPRMEELMTKVLTDDVAWGMLNEHWMADHAEELSERLEGCRVFQKLYKENPWFGNSLPKDAKALLQNKFDSVDAFRTALQMKYERQGVDMEKLEYKSDFHVKNNPEIRSEKEIKEQLEEKKKKYDAALRGSFKLTRKLRFMDNEAKKKAEEELKRTNAAGNEEYREAKHRLKELWSRVEPAEKEKFRKTLEAMAQDIGNLKITKLDYECSLITGEFKNASRDYALMLRRLEGENGETVPLETQVNMLMRLSAAARAYKNTHTKSLIFKGTNDVRLERADIVLSITDRLMDGSLPPQPEPVTEQKGLKIREPGSKEGKAYIDQLAKDLKKMQRGLEDWKALLSRNLVDTPEERLIRYKKFFDTHGRILRLWKTNQAACEKQAGKSVAKIANDAMAEYYRVEKELAFVRWAKEKGNAKEIQANPLDRQIDKHLDQIEPVNKNAGLSPEVDQELDRKQLEAVEEIDRWVLRNVHNGGFLRPIGMMMSDETELASKLLGKTAREKLYIYYLIEKRARVNPTGMDLEESQKYVPNLEKFKDMMLKSKFKFMSRIGGEYIYWDKLTQSLDLSDTARPAMKELWEKKEEKEPLPDAAQMQARKESSKAVLAAAAKYRKLIDECGDDQEALQKGMTEINAAAEELEAAFKLMLGSELSKQDENSLNKNSNKEGTEAVTLALKAGKVFPKLKFFGEVAGGAGIGLATISGALSAICAAAELFADSAHLSGAQVTGKVSDILALVGVTAQGTMEGITGVFQVAETATKAVGVVAGAIGVTAGLINLGINASKNSHDTSAHKLLLKKYEGNKVDEKTREQKYDENLMKLTDNIRNAGDIGAAVAMAGATMALASVLIPVGGLVVSLASIAASVAAGPITNYGVSQALTKLFDDHFELEKLFPVAMAAHRNWQKAEDTATGRVLYRDANGVYHEEKELLDTPGADQIRDNLRNRIAQKYNFSSYARAASLVTDRYAEFIHDKLFKNPGDDIELYKEMVKALGMTYKKGKTPAEDKPSKEMLKKKLLGK